ncbi:MAG: sulfatase-like hydrolase/transferase [Acidimicrobiales bacterium]|nr:sulfatase-like hydrolase/transferase [Acidimicrobiales bacterium]
MSKPDVVIIMTDEERAPTPYEGDELKSWRDNSLTGRKWFEENGISFLRHYTGSLACVPSRPTLFTGQYPDLHGVTQTDGLGKAYSDTRMRWLREGEVPTLGHWFRSAGYDTHYDGKWHISHADLMNPDTGFPLATNTDTGEIIQSAVDAYREANPLDAFGFDGWIGPEPHGAPLANSGAIRDDLIADRIVSWLENRYRLRSEGDPESLRPFLLVASFVNPHDIVLFPAWKRRDISPLKETDSLPPDVPESPTRHEDLATKPAAQIAYKNSYYSAYGPTRTLKETYEENEQEYRNLYYRLHLEVDAPIDKVRTAVTEGNEGDAIIFRTADHGDLLGSHGGLHQKWYNLYDEASRVPFQVARIGKNSTWAREVANTPTSHVDLIPTALALAGLDQAQLSEKLSAEFSEVHPLPGRDLSALIDGMDSPELEARSAYFMTRDNMLEGDTLASGMARALGMAKKPPPPLRIQVPAHVACNFEGIVTLVPEEEAEGGQNHLWKVVRAFDDPSTWSTPFESQLSASPMRGGDSYRTVPIPDQWELYDLTADPIEVNNLQDSVAVQKVFTYMKEALVYEAERSVPVRNNPWPYEKRNPPVEQLPRKSPPPPARALRRLVRKMGMHPHDTESYTLKSEGLKALIVCTNHAWLDVGKPTGLFASEMTVPYYLFSDAGIEVDLASPKGGEIAVDPISLRPIPRSEHDDRFLADTELRTKVRNSISISDIDVDDYDVIFFAGGWGAAFDLGFSDMIGEKVTEANAKNLVLGGVCHGPLGFLKAKNTDGEPLVKGRRVTAVTDKQVKELGIETTPHHPEKELRELGADFQCTHRRRDPLANHWEVDGNIVTGQNQNAGPMVAREIMKLLDEKAEV